MRCWVFVLPLLVVGTAHAQERHLGFRLNPSAAIRIHNLIGTTTVIGWDRDSADIVARVPAGGGHLYAGGIGDAAKIGVEGQDPARMPGSDLTVRVPADARVWIKSASAAVRVESMLGEVEAVAVTGQLSLAGSPRVALLETIDGNVSVEGIAGVLRVRAGSGTVTIDDPKGQRGDVSVTSVQGGITLAAPALLTARLETVSGDIEVRGHLSGSGRLDLETHGGDVHLVLAPPVDARLELTSVAGEVVTALDGRETRHGAGTLSLLVGAAGKKGGAQVTARTFKGTIRVDSNASR
ncbi:MAG: DUF4097 domain-containing protein [Gemmatimonadales bacterium]